MDVLSIFAFGYANGVVVYRVIVGFVYRRLYRFVADVIVQVEDRPSVGVGTAWCGVCHEVCVHTDAVVIEICFRFVSILLGPNVAGYVASGPDVLVSTGAVLV